MTNATLTDGSAPSARFAGAENSAPIVLRDVEDLHDADLDLVLADRLAEQPRDYSCRPGSSGNGGLWVLGV